MRFYHERCEKQKKKQNTSKRLRLPYRFGCWDPICLCSVSFSIAVCVVRCLFVIADICKVFSSMSHSLFLPLLHRFLHILIEEN